MGLKSHTGEHHSPHNVSTHREINNGEKYIELDIYLKFGDLDNIKTTYSEAKKCLGT